MYFSSYLLALSFLAAAFAAPVAQLPSSQQTGTGTGSQPTGGSGGGFGGGHGGSHHHHGCSGGGSSSLSGASETSVPGVFPSGTQSFGTSVPTASIPESSASTTDTAPLGTASPTLSYLSPESSAEGVPIMQSTTALPTLTARQFPTQTFSLPSGTGSSASGFPFPGTPTASGGSNGCPASQGSGPSASGSLDPFPSGATSLASETSGPVLTARQFGQPSGPSFSFGGPRPTGSFPGFGGGSACGSPTFSASAPAGTEFSVPAVTGTTVSPVASDGTSSYSFLTASDAVPSVGGASSAVASSFPTLTLI